MVVEFGGQHPDEALESFAVGGAEFHEGAMGLETEFAGFLLVDVLQGQLEFGEVREAGEPVFHGHQIEHFEIGQSVEDAVGSMDQVKADVGLVIGPFFGQPGEGPDEGAVEEHAFGEVEVDLVDSAFVEAPDQLIEVARPFHRTASADADLGQRGSGGYEDPGRRGRHEEGTLSPCCPSVKHGAVNGLWSVVAG